MWRSAPWIGLVLVAVATLAASCSPRRPPGTLHDLAEAYVRLTLQLAQHRPNLVDAWTGPPAWRPGPRVPVAELRDTLDDLASRAERLRPGDLDPTEGPRLAYLRGQLRALSLITRRLLGESTRFDDEVRLAFGRAIPPSSDAEAARVRAALENELEGPEPLVERYHRFRRRFVIADEQVDRVLASAIEACRAATAAHITLPADEHIEVHFDPSLEWDGYARYAGGHRTRITIAGREGHDVAGLLHLACHETYAGHHLQQVLIDDALVRGRSWIEFQLTPAFGPHLLIAEGAAEAAVDLALPHAARAAIYRDRLLPLAKLPATDAERLARIESLAAALDMTVPPIVARYLDSETPPADAAVALRASALMPSPDRFLAFAARHRTSAVVYPIGKAAVTAWISQGATDAERWRLLQDIFTRRPFSIEPEPR